MVPLFRLNDTVERDPAIEAWFADHSGELGQLARRWFEVMRSGGHDVREVLHDGHPTACIGDVAFGYVNAFKAHVNVGFFRRAELDDPAGLLEGSGKSMRHVKLVPGRVLNAAALDALIRDAMTNVRQHLRATA